MTTLVILAAGLGSRFGGNKQLAQFSCAKLTLMECNICHAIDAGFTKVVFIIRPELRHLFVEQILPKLANKIAVNFVEQTLNDLPDNISLPQSRTKPLGTAHAIWCCRSNIDLNSHFAVINADDYYGAHAFQLLAGNSVDFPNYHLMVAFQLDNTLSEFGGVNRGFCQFDEQQLLQSIDECHDIQRVTVDGQVKITGQFEHSDSIAELEAKTLTSMNCWRFTADIFAELESNIICTINNYYQADAPQNVNSFECYLPNVVMQQIMRSNKKVKLLTSVDTWFGLTFPEDVALVEQSITNLQQQGVFSTLESEPES